MSPSAVTRLVLGTAKGSNMVCSRYYPSAPSRAVQISGRGALAPFYRIKIEA